jgi:uncharacterized repeat protein (TIGR02543 family)
MGGSGTVPAITEYAEGYDYTFTAYQLTQDAKAFLGWTYNGDSITDRTKITIKENVTFVAQWADTYQVTYNLNYAGAPVAPVDNNWYKSGDTVTLPAAPTRDGYDFAGWTRTDSQPTIGADATSFTMGSGPVTLNAQWTPTYTSAVITTEELPNGTYGVWYETTLAAEIPGYADDSHTADRYFYEVVVNGTTTQTIKKATDANSVLKDFGLTLADVGGKISGVPTKAGTIEFKVAMLDGEGKIITLDDNGKAKAYDFTIEINPLAVDFERKEGTGDTKVYGTEDPAGLVTSDKLVVTVNGYAVGATATAIDADGNSFVYITSSDVDQTLSLAFTYTPATTTFTDAVTVLVTRTHEETDPARYIYDDVGQYKIYLVADDVETAIAENYDFSASENFASRTVGSDGRYVLDITAATVTIASWSAKNSSYYIAEPWYPTVTLSGVLGDDDCEPSYSFEPEDKLTNGYPVNAGTYTAIIGLDGEDAGNYELTGDNLSKVFKIVRRPLTSDPVNKPDELASKPYTGNAVEPDLGDLTYKTYTLALDTDYTLSYEIDTTVADNNAELKDGKPLNAGTYNVKLTGKGNYQDDLTYSFVVTQADNSAYVTAADVTYGEALDITYGATFGEVVLTYYKVSGDTQTKLDAAPTAAGDYKVYASVAETPNYKGAVASDAFTIAPAPLTIEWYDVNSTEHEVYVVGDDVMEAWVYTYGGNPQPAAKITNSVIGDDDCDLTTTVYVLDEDTAVVVTDFTKPRRAATSPSRNSKAMLPATTTLAKAETSISLTAKSLRNRLRCLRV